MLCMPSRPLDAPGVRSASWRFPLPRASQAAVADVAPAAHVRAGAQRRRGRPVSRAGRRRRARLRQSASRESRLGVAAAAPAHCPSWSRGGCNLSFAGGPLRVQVHERGRRPQLHPEVDHRADRKHAKCAKGDVERQLRIRLPELGLEHLARGGPVGGGRGFCSWRPARLLFDEVQCGVLRPLLLLRHDLEGRACFLCRWLRSRRSGTRRIVLAPALRLLLGLFGLLQGLEQQTHVSRTGCTAAAGGSGWAW
jgi:hypothetical protein